MIRIYDGNNFFRWTLERDPTGLVHRTILSDLQTINDPVIWVWDGFNGNKRRRDLYPDYKGKRKPPAEGIFASMDLMKKALNHTSAIQVEVPEYEADDVVATLTRRFGREKHTVAIYSTDYDFYQLAAEFPGRVLCGCNVKEAVKADQVRVYKTCVGDVSDNIPGIKGFGQKSWDQNDKQVLKDVVSRWATDGVVLPSDLTRIHLLPRSRKWIEDHIMDLMTYWKIVGFFNVPDDLIEKHTQLGDRNWRMADEMLREFML